jgi:hypothetical protein
MAVIFRGGKYEISSNDVLPVYIIAHTRHPFFSINRLRTQILLHPSILLFCVLSCFVRLKNKDRIDLNLNSRETPIHLNARVWDTTSYKMPVFPLNFTDSTSG